MTGLVVITRPRDEADALATQLARLGYATLIEPMLDIVPMPEPIPPLEPYRALAFTSANGVRGFVGKSGERNMPAYAVGGRTAEALRAAGFTSIREAEGDAEGMAALIGATLGTAGPVLHVTGKAVARDLASLLRPSGIAVDRLTLYDAVPAKNLSAPLVEALYARTIACVLFLSVRTARTFGTLLREHGLADMITSSSALCLSEPIAAEAASLPWRQVRTAARPTADALLALLAEPNDGA